MYVLDENCQIRKLDLRASHCTVKFYNFQFCSRHFHLHDLGDTKDQNT